MTSLFFMRLTKTLMVTTPFFIMILMVLALWGVCGKATYTDQKTMKPQIEFVAGEAKNYLVKGTPNQELSSVEIESPKIKIEEQCVTTKKDSAPEKIVWELVI